MSRLNQADKRWHLAAKIEFVMIMKTINLGKIQSFIFNKSLVVSFSKDWMLTNDNKPLEFEAKIEKSRLVLSANLESLDRTKEVDTNEM